MEINCRRASSMGIPLIRLPVDPMNMAWLILESSFWSLLDRIPIEWGMFGRYSRRGWHFQDKAKSHIQYGPVWALVTPRDIYVYVADPDAIHEIFVRRLDFLLYKPITHGIRSPEDLPLFCYRVAVFPPFQSDIWSSMILAAFSALCCLPMASTKSPSGSVRSISRALFLSFEGRSNTHPSNKSIYYDPPSNPSRASPPQAC